MNVIRSGATRRRRSLSLGGQTAINLAEPLVERGVPIIGTDCAGHQNGPRTADCFEKMHGGAGNSAARGRGRDRHRSRACRAAARIGYPVLVRPSFVLGGRAMQIVSNEERLRHYLKTAVEIDADKPVLVDQLHHGQGSWRWTPSATARRSSSPASWSMVERTGIHSGDSISVYPTFSVSQKAKDKIIDYTVKLGLRIGIVGLYNIQFIVAGEDDVYVIEVNPRSSRTVPFLSKSTGVPHGPHRHAGDSGQVAPRAGHHGGLRP